MNKLDAVLSRVRALPSERQEAIAFELDLLLRDELGEGMLTDDQWADLRRRAAEDQGDPIPHEDVVAEFRALFAR